MFDGEAEVIELVRKAQALEPKSPEYMEIIGILYLACVPRVRNWTYAYDARRDPEDMAHEAILKVIHKLPSIKDPGAFFGWLRKVTINECRQERWKTRRDTPIEEVVEQNTDLRLRENDVDSERWGLALCVDDRAERSADLRLYIERFLGALTPQDRLIFKLRYLVGYSAESIAVTLGMTPKTVRVRFHRIREGLKASGEDPSDILR